jgi:hypothetical protein
MVNNSLNLPNPEAEDILLPTHTPPEAPEHEYEDPKTPENMFTKSRTNIPDYFRAYFLNHSLHHFGRRFANCVDEVFDWFRQVFRVQSLDGNCVPCPGKSTNITKGCNSQPKREALRRGIIYFFRSGLFFKYLNGALRS